MKTHVHEFYSGIDLVYIGQWEREVSVILIVVLSLQMLINPAQAEEVIDPQAEEQPLVICENTAIENLDQKFEELKKNLETSFTQGFPAQLKNNLIESRKNSDEISLQVLNTHIENEQEVIGLSQKALDHLEAFITLLPKVVGHAPKVREDYVIPLSNVSSLKAEDSGKACSTPEAVAEVKAPAQETTEISESVKKFALISSELNRLNTNLYEAQSISPQRFVNFRAELQELFNDYNRSRTLETAARIKTRIPEIVNNIQREVETILPGFELSQKYMAIVGL